MGHPEQPTGRRVPVPLRESRDRAKHIIRLTAKPIMCWPCLSAPSRDKGKIAMQTIDYIYRFDPLNPSAKPSPPDAEAARKTLEDGNRMFSKWMGSCRSSTLTTRTPPREVSTSMAGHSRE